MTPSCYLTVTTPDSTVRPWTVQKNEKLPARGKRTLYVPTDWMVDAARDPSSKDTPWALLPVQTHVTLPPAAIVTADGLYPLSKMMTDVVSEAPEPSPPPPPPVPPVELGPFPNGSSEDSLKHPTAA